MKVLAVVVVIIASVSAKGSGPYLPSGWRPDGPAFFLPSENQKLSENSIKDVIFASSEASGTNALREYGPPRVQVPSQVIINQGLPDVDVEKNFIDTVFTSKDEENNISSFETEKEIAANPGVTLSVHEIKEELTNKSSIEESETTTEYKQNEFITEQPSQEQINQSESNLLTKLNDDEVKVVDPNLNLQKDTERDTKNNIYTGIETIVEFKPEDFTTYQPTQEIVGGESEITVSKEVDATLTVTESLEGVTQSESTTASDDENSREGSLKQAQVQLINNKEIALNISQLAVDLVKQTNSEIADSHTAATTSSEEGSGLDTIPEGFLEYGPPGFKEYGPPKVELDTSSEENLQQVSLNPNEIRRRRYTAKFI